MFEQSLWQAVPAFLRGVDAALHRATGRSMPLEVAPLQFGSWIGGDRDGNPNVTPEVTRKACLLARWQAADLYLSEVNALRDELSITRLKLAERKVIERAKGLLMDRHHCTEDEAYRKLRRLAMDKNLKLSDVAQRMIDVAALLL